MLTRQEMEAIIRKGESVMLHPMHVGGFTDTRVISRVEDLPTEAELAGDDESKRHQARQELLARRSALDAELARLEAPQSPRVTGPRLRAADQGDRPHDAGSRAGAPAAASSGDQPQAGGGRTGDGPKADPPRPPQPPQGGQSKTK
jgi:hypothetical protein